MTADIHTDNGTARIVEEQTSERQAVYGRVEKSLRPFSGKSLGTATHSEWLSCGYLDDL
ncbi:MAG: hypothetical protein U0X75_13700 [Acidobacteriota bacterium]